MAADASYYEEYEAADLEGRPNRDSSDQPAEAIDHYNQETGTDDQSTDGAERQMSNGEENLTSPGGQQQAHNGDGEETTAGDQQHDKLVDVPNKAADGVGRTAPALQQEDSGVALHDTVDAITGGTASITSDAAIDAVRNMIRESHEEEEETEHRRKRIRIVFKSSKKSAEAPATPSAEAADAEENDAEENDAEENGASAQSAVSNRWAWIKTQAQRNQDNELVEALSVPYFGTFRVADLQDERVVRALMNEAEWADEDDDAQTVVIKNLIVLFHLTNSMEQCLGDGTTAPQRAHAWAQVCNLWGVTAFVVPEVFALLWCGPNPAQRAVDVFARMRREVQLRLEDKKDWPMPDNPLVFLLLELVAEHERFITWRTPQPFIAEEAFQQLMITRRDELIALLKNEDRRSEVFTKLWPCFEGRYEWDDFRVFKGEQEDWERLYMDHRNRTAKAIESDWFRSLAHITFPRPFPTDFYDNLPEEIRPAPMQIIVENDLSAQLFVANQAENRAQGRPFVLFEIIPGVPMTAPPGVAAVQPTPPTYAPYRTYVRLDQTGSVGSDERPRSSIIFSLHGPTDRGQELVLLASPAWTVARTWRGTAADVPEGRDYYRVPKLVERDVKMFDLKGRDGEDTFEEGEHMNLWVTLVEDDAGLNEEDGPHRAVAVCFFCRSYIRQPMWLTAPQGWKVRGPIDGRDEDSIPPSIPDMDNEMRELLMEWREMHLHPDEREDDGDEGMYD